MSNKVTHYLDEDFPNLVEYFIDKSLVHKSSLSKTKVEVICPCCKKIHLRTIRTIYSCGNTYCSMCNDNYSFPERFMSAVLDNLNIKYKYQFTDSWTEQYKYDFLIFIGDMYYIVELDGGLGHGHDRGLDRRTSEETKEIDNIKDDLACKNNYRVIRINCDYENENRFEFIKNNIINSELSNFIDFSSVNWNMCFQQACSSRYSKALKFYKSGCKYLDDISKEVGLASATIKKFLLHMMEVGIIQCEPLYRSNPIPNLPVPVIADKKYYGGASTPVYCYEDAIYFRTMQDADDYYNFPRFKIRNSISSYNGYCKGKHFTKFKDLPKDFDFKPKFFSDDKYRDHAYCQWTLDGELKNIYVNKKNLPNEFKYLSIQRVINDTFNTAYGYKWSILPKELEYQYIKGMDAIERPILLQTIQEKLKGDKYHGN